MKTINPLCHHHNDFVPTLELEHMISSYNFNDFNEPKKVHKLSKEHHVSNP